MLRTRVNVSDVLLSVMYLRRMSAQSAGAVLVASAFALE